MNGNVLQGGPDPVGGRRSININLEILNKLVYFVN